MKINKITTQVSASPQISSENITAIKAAGFKSIICHRPDGEDSDQQNQREIQAVAEKEGIAFKYQPIINVESITSEDIEQFATYLHNLPEPVLIYCRTGTRSTSLWSLSQADKISISQIMKLTQRAGYNMSDVLRRITDGR